ncbi:MAG TPA: hypothetical protein VMC84_11825 [Methanocella sp.]|uniref:hypothetical protein n=1 Tax=Methanocella sp. TaxID=2052833 RepID=UPI002BE03A21|nr:hypothetical protein [Methanocella sp.]HTY91854.1 hypothetical protein [Methanocella sp.]
MKYRYTAIFIILIALAAAGCTSTTQTSPAASTQPAASGTPTTASNAASGSTLSSMIDFSKVNWYEYRMTSDTGGTSTTSDLRWDYNIDYNGHKANKATMNMNMGTSDSATTEVITSYTDVASGATLGGHIKMMTGSQVVLDQDIQPGASATTTPGASTENPLTTYQGTSVTKIGTESVTVPAGTYTATKYTWTSGSNTGNVWVAPNVPIPVKMSYSAASSTTDMELVGWG